MLRVIHHLNTPRSENSPHRRVRPLIQRETKDRDAIAPELQHRVTRILQEIGSLPSLRTALRHRAILRENWHVNIRGKPVREYKQDALLRVALAQEPPPVPERRSQARREPRLKLAPQGLRRHLVKRLLEGFENPVVHLVPSVGLEPVDG